MSGSDLQVAQVFPARILLEAEGRATVAQLTTLAKGKALDPSIFEDARFAPIFLTPQISSNRLDAYATRMAPSTLRNFADDAKAGVSYQDSHMVAGQIYTLGQSIGARYFGPGSRSTPEGVAAVEADVYTMLGMDPAIDSYINKVRAGITKDVSVGFYGGTYRCSICQRDMRDYSDWSNYCPHYPGQKIAVKDASGKPTDERQTVEASIEDARLAEISGVYDGATPEASILVIKAKELADAGKLDPKEARFIEDRYRYRIPGTLPIHAVGIDLARLPRRGAIPPPAPKEGEMTPEEQLRALLADHGLAEGGDLVAFVRDLATGTSGRIATALAARDEQVRGALATAGLSCEGDDLLAAIRGQGDGLAALRRDAGHGEKAHKALVEETAREAVRAFGEKFTPERRKALDGLDFDELTDRRDTYKEIGDKRLPGGRATREGDPPDNSRLPANGQGGAIPLAAYRTGR